ncbi:hypothetical protein GCM10020218_096090 [Dactylosporangium vinaceum]
MRPDAVAAVRLGRLPIWIVAAGTWLAIRAAGVVALLIAGGTRPLTDLLTSYDGDWYVEIAVSGYDHGLHDDGHGGVKSNLAFSPLLPVLIRAVMAFGLHPDWAAIVVAGACGLVAAVLLSLLGRHLGGRRCGILLAAGWAALPHAVVETMAYTEGLFVALAAASVLALLRGRLVSAAAWCAAAGLARPSAVALVATVWWVALVARQGRRSWVAVVGAPVGVCAWWIYVAVRVGHPAAWWHIQRAGWNSRFDFGREAAWGVLWQLPRHPTLPLAMVAIVTAAFAALAVVSFRIPLQPAVRAYTFFTVVLAIGSAGTYLAKARFLLIAFTALVPAVVWLASRPQRVQVAVIAVMAAGSVGYGVFLLTGWTHSP